MYQTDTEMLFNCSEHSSKAPPLSSVQSPSPASFWVLSRVSRLVMSCWKVIAERSRWRTRCGSSGMLRGLVMKSVAPLK